MSELLPKKNLAWTLAGMTLWNLIVAIDATALGIALPTISRDIHANTNQAFWCGTSFILCSAALQPIISSFSNVFGRRPMLALSLVLFTIGAIICGVAQNVTVLLLGRCIQGCGAGGLLTLTYVVMSDELTLQERHKAISAISLAWLFGTVLGPIMSGGFTQHASWRWIFWINLPFCVVCLAIVTFCIKSSYKSQQSITYGLRHMDWFGSVLFVGSLTSLLIALSWGGTMFAWKSWRTIAPLAIGVAGLMVWIAYSVWITEEPLIPVRIMKNRTASISYLGNVITGLAQFGMIFYLPLYYQVVQSYSPTVSGVALLPQCLVAGVFSAVTGILITRYNTVKPFVIAGWVVYTIGLGLLTLLQPNTTVVEWIFINVPSGIGLGSLIASLVLATQAAAEVSNVRSAAEISRIKALAGGLNPFFRTLGQSLGIVIAQAAFTNELKKHLGNSAALDATTLGAQISFLPKDSAEHEILVDAFNSSLRVVWWVLFGLAAGMLCITIFTKNIGLVAKDPQSGSRSASASNLSLNPKPTGNRTPQTLSRIASTIGASDLESAPSQSMDNLSAMKPMKLLMPDMRSFENMCLARYNSHGGSSGVNSPIDNSSPPSPRTEHQPLV